MARNAARRPLGSHGQTRESRVEIRRVARQPVSSHSRIHAVVKRIPRGRVATYGAVAALAGMPRHARLVGYALHALPEGTPLPWHRVVGAGGRLSLMRSGRSSGLTQRIRLEREGVRFDARGRVDMDVYGWRPGRRSRRQAPLKTVAAFRS